MAERLSILSGRHPTTPEAWASFMRELNVRLERVATVLDTQSGTAKQQAKLIQNLQQPAQHQINADPIQDTTDDTTETDDPGSGGGGGHRHRQRGRSRLRHHRARADHTSHLRHHTEDMAISSATDAVTLALTGTPGQIAFWNTITTITGDAALIWDNINKRLGIGAAIPGTTVDVIGDLALQATSIALVNGANNNVAIGARSVVRITGPSAPYSITGFANGFDGKLLVVENTVAQALTIANLNGGSSASNQIKTLTGADVILPVGSSSAWFFYDTVQSLWILAGTSPLPSGTGSVTSISAGSGITLTPNPIVATGSVAVTAQKLLNSTIFNDVLAGTVVRGDLIVGNSTPAWSRIAKGTANQVLGMGASATDAAWVTLTKAMLPLPLDHHADLTSFTANDDHTQYLFLAGRAGGQVANGGVNAGDNLTLQANNNASATGNIVLAPNFKSTQSIAALFNPTTTGFDGAILELLNLTPNFTFSDAGGAQSSLVYFNGQGTFTFPAVALAAPSIWNLMQSFATYLSTGGSLPGATAIFINDIMQTNAAQTGISVGDLTGLHFEKQFHWTAGTTFAVNSPGNLTAVMDQPTSTGGGLPQIGTRRGLWFKNSLTGATSIAQNVALRCDNQTTSVNNTVVQSVLVAGATNFFLNDAGGAQSSFVGLFSKYHNDTTAGNGMASVVGSVNNLASSTVTGTTTLYTTVAEGEFIVCGNLVTTTTQAGADTITLTIGWTDASSTARTATCTCLLQTAASAGTIAPTAINAKSGTTITWATTQSGAIGLGRFSVDVSVLRLS